MYTFSDSLLVQLGIRQLRSALRETLERVAAGESVTIVRHGRAVARIVPAAHEPAAKLPSLSDFRASVRAPRRALSAAVVEERRDARA